jgi:serine/threonine-protein kinase
MGVVYEARDASGRSVALKAIDPQHAHDPRFMERFRRESRVATAIDHPNVVRVIAVGEADGSPFIVSELCAGGSLAAKLARGPLAWRDAARVGAQIARGLMAVHAAGLVHRDVKPSNVLLDASGDAKLADFGIVGKGKESTSDEQTLTKTGELLGTLAYMAPEQAETGKVDARADLYSLGATLHELLAGRPPFDGTGYGLVKAHLTERPRPPGALVHGIPKELDALVLRLLAKHPDARPSSAIEVAKELDAIAAGRSSSRRVLLAGAFVVLALAAAAAARAFSRDAARPAATPAPPPPDAAPPPRPPSPPAPPAPAATDGASERWDLLEGKKISACSFAPDGTFFVTGNADGLLELWDPASAAAPAKPLASVKADDAIVWCSTFTPDGARLLTGSYDRKVKVWDTAKLRAGGGLLDTEEMRGEVSALAVSPNAQHVVVGLREALWPYRLRPDGVLELDGNAAMFQGDVYAAAAFIGNDTCVCGTLGGNVPRYDVVRRIPLETDAPNTHHGHAVSVAVSPSLGWLLVSSWDTGALATVFSLPDMKPTSLPASGTATRTVAFAADGKRAFAAGLDGIVRILDTRSWEVVGRLQCGHVISNFVLAPRDDRAVVVTEDGHVQLWDHVH